MSGIISGALQGIGEAGLRLTSEYASYLRHSTLQTEAAAVQKARDERLAELSERAAVQAEERKRAPYKAAEAEFAAGKGGLVDDASGTVRPRTETEDRQLGVEVYRKHGLINEALRMDDAERQRERDSQAVLARTRDDNRADRQLEGAEKDREENRKYRSAMLALQNAQEGRLSKTADLEASIKKFTLDNLNRREALQAEFSSATPERKRAITEEIQLLTGKDNDNFLPVPLMDEYKNITGYRVFDKKRGVFVDGNASAGGASEIPEAAIAMLKKNPKLAVDFDKKYGAGAAARYVDPLDLRGTMNSKANPAKWDPTSGKVYLDGEEIGQAPTKGAAMEVVARARAGSATREAPKLDATLATGATDASVNSPVGRRLDEARAAKADAHSKLLAFGARGRKADPRAYADAERQFEEAKAAEAAALAEWERSMGSDVTSRATLLRRP